MVFLFFLWAFSWETDLWVTLSDFTLKKPRKIGKRNLYITENQLGGNEIWCAADNYNYMYHMCAKGFLDSTFNLAFIDKISNFQEIAPNFTYSQKSYFWKYKWTLIDQLILPYKFMVETCKEYTFHFFQLRAINCLCVYVIQKIAHLTNKTMMLKGVLHLLPQKAPKLACFVLYLKIITIFLKNNICIL